MTNKEFLELQKTKIEIHKWIESEKAGRDLGQEAIFDWIRNHARQFREENKDKIQF